MGVVVFGLGGTVVDITIDIGVTGDEFIMLF